MTTDAVGASAGADAGAGAISTTVEMDAEKVKKAEVVRYSKYLIEKAKYDILLAERKNAAPNAQIARSNDKELKVLAVMDHKLGHRRIRGLCEKNDAFRKLFVDHVLSMINDDFLNWFLRTRGVFVLVECVNRAESDEEKKKLKDALKSHVTRVIDEELAEDATKRLTGLKQLAELLN